MKMVYGFTLPRSVKAELADEMWQMLTRVYCAVDDTTVPIPEQSDLREKLDQLMDFVVAIQRKHIEPTL